MNKKTFNGDHSSTILIVQDRSEKIELDSPILTNSNVVCFSNLENTTLLSWIQQNQPDLIILKLMQTEESFSSLITPLRLDWLTRNIPIIVTGDIFTLKSVANLDFNASLTTPYSAKELDGVICSLIRTSGCQIFAG